MKTKFNFGFKLIISLVSLFASLLLVIIGSKNNYCLSFGMVFLGVSLELFMVYLNDKYQKEIVKIAQEIDEIEVSEEISEEEKVYIINQLYARDKRVDKKRKRTNIVFSACGAIIILLGVLNLF